MHPGEEYQYSMLYEDEDYVVWVDLKHRVVNISSSERGLKLYFGCEEFEACRETIKNYFRTNTNKQNTEVYLDQSSLTLHFSRNDLQNFGDMMNRLGLMPKWWVYWYHC